MGFSLFNIYVIMLKFIHISFFLFLSKLVKQLIADWTPICLSSTPHLCVQDHGGSSHPLLEGGLGCPGHQAPAGPIQSLSQGGCQAAADLRGEVAVVLEARVQHGRGAAPGAAAAVSRQGDRHRVGRRE